MNKTYKVQFVDHSHFVVLVNAANENEAKKIAMLNSRWNELLIDECRDIETTFDLYSNQCGIETCHTLCQ